MDCGGKANSEHSEKQKLENELNWNDCNYKPSNKQHLKTHQKAIHEGANAHVTYPCGQLDYQATEKGSLNTLSSTSKQLG